MGNLYAYYRVSTQTQAEQNGIEMQIAEVEKYAKENNIELIGSFKDHSNTGGLNTISIKKYKF